MAFLKKWVNLKATISGYLRLWLGVFPRIRLKKSAWLLHLIGIEALSTTSNNSEVSRAFEQP